MSGEDAFKGETLKFPLECQYRIITEDREGIVSVIEAVLQEMGFDAPIREGNTSAGGKYRTHHVTLTVESLVQMRLVDEALRSIEGVRMVL